MICPRKGSDSLLARPLFSWSTRWGARGGSFLFLSIDTGPKGVHEIDHLWCRTLFDRLDLFPSLLLFEQINQRVLLSILELCRIEMANLVLNDVRREIEHVFRELQIGNVFEIRLFIANFVGIAKREPQ